MALINIDSFYIIYPLISLCFSSLAFYFGRIFWYLSLIVTYSSDNTTIYKQIICVISLNSTLYQQDLIILFYIYL